VYKPLSVPIATIAQRIRLCLYKKYLEALQAYFFPCHTLLKIRHPMSSNHACEDTSMLCVLGERALSLALKDVMCAVPSSSRDEAQTQVLQQLAQVKLGKHGSFD
jgi:hypothetical protein